MERVRDEAVVVELLGLELVQREDHGDASAPEADERADERDVREDPGLVLDEDDVGVAAHVGGLLREVRVVEMAHAHERDVVAARAEPVRDRQGVVVDAAALVARQDDDPPLAVLRQLPAGEGERGTEPLFDPLAGELRQAPASALDEVAAQARVVDGALERRGHRVGRLVLEEQTGVAERPGDRARRVGDDR